MLLLFSSSSSASLRWNYRSGKEKMSVTRCINLPCKYHPFWVTNFHGVIRNCIIVASSCSTWSTWILLRLISFPYGLSPRTLHQCIYLSTDDNYSPGLLVSITIACYNHGKFIGVAGTDINIEDLMPDFTKYFKQGRTTYTFMITKSGRTLIHPLLPAPADAYGHPIYMDIRNLERPEADFKEVFESMTKYVVHSFAWHRGLWAPFIIFQQE